MSGDSGGESGVVVVRERGGGDGDCEVQSYTCSEVQKICASSCWNLLTRVRPERAPEISFLCSTPKSAILKGSSLQDRGRWSNIKLKE